MSANTRLDPLLRPINRLRKRTSEWSSRIRRRSRREPASEAPILGRPVHTAWEDEYAKWRPAELPPRTHALTPSSSNESLPLPLASQSQSPLFSKLPAEIRLQIYRAVLGDKTIHILLQNPGLSHVVCYEPWKDDWWRHTCLGPAWEAVGTYVGRTESGGTTDGGKLGLLRSCRRVYSESIDFLYTTNMFDINERDRLVDLSRTLLPQRLAAIGGLNFRYFHSTMYNNDPSLKIWRSVIDILKKMTGLKTLKLEISTEKPAVLHSGTTTVEEKRLLEPLKEVTHVKDFVVELNWVERRGSTGNAEEWPFVLRRLTHR